MDFYRSHSFLQCFVLERLAFIVLSLLNFYGCHNSNLFFWCSLYVLGLDIGPDYYFFANICFWSSNSTNNLVYFCGLHDVLTCARNEMELSSESQSYVKRYRGSKIRLRCPLLLSWIVKWICNAQEINYVQERHKFSWVV